MFTKLSSIDTMKAIGVGLITSLAMLIVMKLLFATGFAPMPAPPSEAFAATIAGQSATPALAAVLHFLWGTLWAVVYVGVFRDRLDYKGALWIGLAMWLLAVLIFFPIVGWGMLGLNIAPMVPVAALVVHLVYLTVMWFTARLLFQTSRPMAY